MAGAEAERAHGRALARGDPAGAALIARAADGRVELAGDPRGIAYVDGDALPAEGSREVDAVVAASEEEGLAAFRRRAAAVAARVPDGAGTEVVGAGVIAVYVRALVPVAAGRPAALVDFTGDPAVVAAAFARLSDLGTLVLAGTATGARLDLDPYPDLHLRGLRVIGVPPGAEAADPGPAQTSPGPPVDVVPGEPVPLGAVWYRVAPG